MICAYSIVWPTECLLSGTASDFSISICVPQKIALAQTLGLFNFMASLASSVASHFTFPMPKRD